MKKAIRITWIIDLVKAFVYMAVGLGLGITGIVLLSSDPKQEDKLGYAGILVLGLLFLIIALFGLYWLGTLKREVNKDEGYDAHTTFKYALFGVIFAQMPSGVVALIDHKRRKEEGALRGVNSANNELYGEVRPRNEEGYCAETNTVVHLVSRRNNGKAYQTRGIEDIGAKNNWKGWLYLAPVIILVAVFLIYPLINTIFIAFTVDYNYATGTFDGMTLTNFTYILGLTDRANGAHETYFTKYAIVNTIICVVVTVPVSTLLALLIAVALNSIKWFQKVLQTIFFLPYVTNAIAVGMVFSVIFDEQGIINFLFGTNTVWIRGADHWVAMIPLCLYIIWSSIPFKILILLSGLQGIDKQYYQAAQIDSAPKAKVLWRVTVPLLSPQILYILITSFIGAWKEYTAVVGLFNGPGTLGTAGDPNMETIVYYIYENLSNKTSYAAAAAVFLFVIILLFTALQFAVSKKRVHY